MIIYNEKTGIIQSITANEHNPLDLFVHFSEEFKKDLGVLDVDLGKHEMNDYIVKDGVLVKLNNEEKRELMNYGRFLTKEEKMLNQMKPSEAEIRQAEDEIRMLELFKELIE